MRKFYLFIAVFCVALSGYAFANKSAKKSDWKNFVRGNVKVTAISMNAWEDGPESKRLNPPNFHGEEIVGQKQIFNHKDIKLLKQIILSLDGSYQPATVSLCIPSYRHGLKFESKGRKVEAIICFECGVVAVFRDGRSHDVYVNSKWLEPLNALYKRNKMRLPDYYLSNRE